MQAYVINLARSPERRVHMVRELRKAGIDYEFVVGTDGRDVDLSDTRLVDRTQLDNSPFSSGIVGCYLSHLEVFGKVLETDTERALVLEDDVVLPIDMTALVEGAAMHMAGAEAVLLHHHRRGRAERDGAYSFFRRDSVQLPGLRALAFPTDVRDLRGTGAYLITRDACARMTKMMLPIKVPIDDWAFFYNEGALDRVRGVVPMPVGINSGFRTTIEHHAPNTIQTRLRNAAIRAPLLSQALTMRRERLMARRTQVELVEDS
jgi:glycosyl transferase, family 25